MSKNSKRQARPSGVKGETVDSAVCDQVVHLQHSTRISVTAIMFDAAFAAACHAAVITVLSWREGFELLAQRGMMMFFILAALYIAMSKVSSLSKA